MLEMARPLAKRRLRGKAPARRDRLCLPDEIVRGADPEEEIK